MRADAAFADKQCRRAPHAMARGVMRAPLGGLVSGRQQDRGHTVRLVPASRCKVDVACGRARPPGHSWPTQGVSRPGTSEAEMSPLATRFRRGEARWPPSAPRPASPIRTVRAAAPSPTMPTRAAPPSPTMPTRAADHRCRLQSNDATCPCCGDLHQLRPGHQCCGIKVLSTSGQHTRASPRTICPNKKQPV
ncbi:hypothetical protein PVAP13_1NG206600 [Panicum virgatum]|uniref:Uncharacterized protein n=1 Tax=Panicum virgatum TaxID=38727 RepID=A0A8T0WUC2_PANVG|nr:hypothetical protein PVAP13_1NG206600 [Panicum virgatum]